MNNSVKIIGFTSKKREKIIIPNTELFKSQSQPKRMYDEGFVAGELLIAKTYVLASQVVSCNRNV